ncbi:MAG: hypothetical protein OEO23_06130 [Gemmatimonadota bacterium]|nr:hypothetical protein [Gemmatimonadota bacterium]
MSTQRSLAINPAGIWLALGGIAALLVMASLGFSAAKNWWWNADPYGLSGLFRLNAEGNVPSFFSGLLFLLNSGLLAAVAWARWGDGWRRWVWGFLAALFMFLAFDELFGVHEALIEPMRQAWELSGLFYFSWILVYVPATVLLGAIFLPVWLKMKPRDRLRFAASAVTYLAGAVGLEMVGGARYEAVGAAGDTVYALIYTAEESLEMAGLILLLASLLYLLADELGEVTVTFGVRGTP